MSLEAHTHALKQQYRMNDLDKTLDGTSNALAS